MTVAVLGCSFAALSLSAWAADKKTKTAASPGVDSGSFGVFIKGQRVLTESFHIEQANGLSTIKAQLKDATSSSTVQKCELAITSSGDLIHYDWSQDSDGSLTVVPSNDFLIEKITLTAGAKTSEQPFLMPISTMILDNNFFVLREVLAWRYLATVCKPEGCPQTPIEFGVLVPQDHTSLRVRVELVGKEKVSVHGAERELLRINLTGETFEWSLWVDAQDHFKLMRVTIPADNTEVIRD
jgi:hypothetical protein